MRFFTVHWVIMPKIKLTKGELKKQRDALKQYERYLPTLQLKKQQLQIEISRQMALLEAKARERDSERKKIERWSALLSEPDIDIRPWITPREITAGSRNIAGVDLPVFRRAEFTEAEYDLFTAPLWIDAAVESLRNLVSMLEEITVIEKGVDILRQELRITTQRVNLFEKIKIPEASETIRLIKIYLGDQMANAVGRSKIAKRKIEAFILEEVAA